MPFISSDALFLGVDLKALWLELRQSWQQLHQSPVLSWLTPDAPVLLLQADGGQSLWRGDTRFSTKADASSTSFIAIELPPERVLQRSLAMPAAMSAVDLAHAAALEARTFSPFAAHDLVWGYRAHAPRRGHCQVDIVLASRRQIAQYLTEQTDRLKGFAVPEIWVLAQNARPVVLAGFGETARHAFTARRRRLGYGLLALALALVAAMAITPTLQLRLRALQAVAAYDSLAARTAPVVRQRELLLQSAEHMNGLAELLADRMEPLRVLEKLTQVLPDDTALQSFKLQGTKVMLGGLTSNTAALLQLLGQQAGLREVRSPAAATRMGASGKESFSIELMLDPEVFGVPKVPAASLVPLPARTPASAVSPAPAPSAAASFSTTAPAAPLATAPAAGAAPLPPSAAPPPAPGASGRATFGGGAVFGGSPTRPPASTAAAAPAPASSSPPATRPVP